jgi:nitrite reductase/ring-hydroxylating ferredoxin subunit/uncharacterized membrane protein
VTGPLVTTGERIERRIVGGDWLDDVAARLQAAIRGVLEPPLGGRLIDVLHGTWLGHPLHPALTDIPVGCWTAAVVLDAASVLRGQGGERPAAADAVSAVGVVGALAAAAAGAADWSKSGTTGSRVGLVHAALNVGATGLAGAGLLARRRRRARLLRLACLTVATGGAWLGGKLVYGESLGVDHTAWQGGPEEWTDVLAAELLPEGRLVRAEVGGLPVVLLRRGEEILAIGDTCSHLGGPLSEGELERDVVSCPWHGSRFSMRDGSVQHGPATFAQPCLEARIREGRVEVREPLPGAPLS